MEHEAVQGAEEGRLDPKETEGVTNVDIKSYWLHFEPVESELSKNGYEQFQKIELWRIDAINWWLDFYKIFEASINHVIPISEAQHNDVLNIFLIFNTVCCVLFMIVQCSIVFCFMMIDWWSIVLWNRTIQYSRLKIFPRKMFPMKNLFPKNCCWCPTLKNPTTISVLVSKLQIKCDPSAQNQSQVGKYLIEMKVESHIEVEPNYLVRTYVHPSLFITVGVWVCSGYINTFEICERNLSNGILLYYIILSRLEIVLRLYWK